VSEIECSICDEETKSTCKEEKKSCPFCDTVYCETHYDKVVLGGHCCSMSEDLLGSRRQYE